MACWLTTVAPVRAQQIFGPPSRLRDVEDLERGERPSERPRVLPKLDLSSEPGTEALAAGRPFRVERIHVEGATLLPADVIAEMTKPHEGREVVYAEIEALRARITQAYVDRGYVTSGAVIPDQTLVDGVLRIEVVEGRLVSVEVETDGRLRTNAIRRRLERAAGGVPNVFTLENALQLIQQEPLIEKVDAELVPGEQRGEATLVVKLTEAPAYRASATADNEHNPVIGEFGGVVTAVNRNLMGFADELQTEGSVTEGLWDVNASYRIPIGSRGTAIAVEGRATRAKIIAESFEDLDIESRFYSVGVTLSQDLFRSLRSSASAFVSGELRRYETRLGGEPASLESVAKPHLTVIRPGLDWTWRERDRVIAARSVFSFGIDALDATTSPSTGPDGVFFAWLGQLQLAQRLPWRDVQAIVRADAQLTDGHLIAIERLAMGGMSSVRGYRENDVLRDNGIVVSGELRVPFYQAPAGRLDLALVPFMDFGRGWNEGDQRRRETLWSVGIGTRARLLERLGIEFYWARSLQDRERGLSHSIQDDGIHFRASLTYP